jgi:hypothetical protein
MYVVYLGSYIKKTANKGNTPIGRRKKKEERLKRKIKRLKIKDLGA